MHGNIPFMFDYWTNLVVHLLLKVLVVGRHRTYTCNLVSVKSSNANH